MNAAHENLVRAACEQRRHSYSPYSKFRVGAALLDRDGRVHLGTNVENASYGLSICAERSAIARAVSDGQQQFAAIAICADGPQPTAPCGACRQVLREFGDDLPVILVGENGLDGEVLELTVGDLLPHAFFDFASQLQERQPGKDTP